MPDALAVRPLRPEDRAAWLPLRQGCLAFHEAGIPGSVTDLTWGRLNDPAEPMEALGAFAGGRLLGIAHLVFHRSTWTEGPYCYLQDLFTAQDARGRGVGRALIEAVYARAREAGAGRDHGLTHETNAAARRLYDEVATRSGFIQYRTLL